MTEDLDLSLESRNEGVLDQRLVVAVVNLSLVGVVVGAATIFDLTLSRLARLAHS